MKKEKGCTVCTVVVTSRTRIARPSRPCTPWRERVPTTPRRTTSDRDVANAERASLQARVAPDTASRADTRERAL
jgi:hypothetical protein